MVLASAGKCVGVMYALCESRSANDAQVKLCDRSLKVLWKEETPAQMSEGFDYV